MEPEGCSYVFSEVVSFSLGLSGMSKDNIGMNLQTTCFSVHQKTVTNAKWRDILEKEQFSSQIVAISGDEAQSVSKW